MVKRKGGSLNQDLPGSTTCQGGGGKGGEGVGGREDVGHIIHQWIEVLTEQKNR